MNHLKTCKWCVGVLLACLTVFTGCNHDSGTNQSAAFESYPDYASKIRIEAPDYFVLRSKSDLDEFNTKYTNKAEPPEIDFTQDMLLVVSHGWQSSTCWPNENDFITSVALADNALAVTVELQVPETACDAEATPAAVVSLVQTNLPIKIEGDKLGYDTDESFLDKKWSLYRQDDNEVTAPYSNFDLIFESDGDIHASGACNSLHGQYQLVNDVQVKIIDASWTEIGCDGNLEEVEFFTHLSSVASFHFNGFQLKLFYKDGNTKMVFKDKQQVLSARLQSEKAEFKSRVEKPLCEVNTQCLSVGLGDKPCGGFYEYLIYSTATLTGQQQETLLSDIAAHNELEAQYNQTYEIDSDCGYVEEPVLQCGGKGLCEMYR